MENYDGGHNINKKRCWLIRIRQDQQHGNKPTLMVTNTQTERDVG